MKDEDILKLLQAGQMVLAGSISWSSNYTFLARVCQDGQEREVIYKPARGERPLWDFAWGTLCQRERAAYLVSEALGWGIVPPTVVRDDGPHGRGSVQLFVEHDAEEHYFTFRGKYTDQLQRIALFDIIINNADRKSGHVLLGSGGKLWAIDHGICFHEEPKLRSVVWDFAGDPLPAGLLAESNGLQQRLRNRHDPLRCELDSLLAGPEVKALQRRLVHVVNTAIFPNPDPGRHYPWPLV